MNLNPIYNQYRNIYNFLSYAGSMKSSRIFVDSILSGTLEKLKNSQQIFLQQPSQLFQQLKENSSDLATAIEKMTTMVTKAGDKNEIKNIVIGFVSEVNSYIDFIEEKNAYITGGVLKTLKSYIINKKNELDSIGITQVLNGKLGVNQDVLQQAIDQNMNTLKEVLNGKHGLAQKIKTFSSLIAYSFPFNYAKEFSSTKIMNFYDYLYSSQAGMLSQFRWNGLFIDGFF